MAALVVAVVVIVACGRPAPPPVEPQQPSAPTYKLVAQQGVTVPGTDTPVTVGAWIEEGKDRYQPGETLILYLAIRGGRHGAAIEKLIKARIVALGSSSGGRRGDSPQFFDSIDALAEHYTKFTPAPPLAQSGWAVAWQSEPRHYVSASTGEWLTYAVGAEANVWTDAGRIEIPHDEVGTWMIGPFTLHGHLASETPAARNLRAIGGAQLYLQVAVLPDSFPNAPNGRVLERSMAGGH